MAIKLTIPNLLVLGLAFVFIRHFVANDITELVVDDHRHDNTILVSFGDVEGSDYNGWNTKCIDLSTGASSNGNSYPHDFTNYETTSDECKDMYGEANLYKDSMGDARIVHMPKREYTPTGGIATPTTCTLVCDTSSNVVYKATQGATEGVPVHFKTAHKGSLVTWGVVLAWFLGFSDIVFAVRAVWRAADRNYPKYISTKVIFWAHFLIDLFILVVAFVCNILYAKWLLEHRPDEHKPKVLDALVSDVLSVNVTTATFMTTRLAYYIIAVYTSGSEPINDVGRLASKRPGDDESSYPEHYRSSLRNRNV